jgi:hypothetical protein
MSNRTILQIADMEAHRWYERILDFCAVRCPTLSFVTRTMVRARLTPKALSFFDEAKPYVEREQLQVSWPGGGTLAGDANTVTYLTTSADSIGLLKRRSKSPFDWVHFDLPEDLAFYRPDGSPFFVVIGHERVAYFDASEGERAELERAIPDIIFSSVGTIVLNMDDDELPPDSE